MFRDNYFTCVTTGSFTVVIDNNDKVWYFGEICYYTDGSSIPKQISGLSNIKAIDCGSNHIVCLDYDYKVYSIGDNFAGKLGIGKNAGEVIQTFQPQRVKLPPISQIACGVNFTICLSLDKQLWAFGTGVDGQLGLDTLSNKLSPVLIPNLYNIEMIVCGGYRAICRTLSKDYYVWGYGGQGQLGTGDKGNYNKPIKCSNWPDNIISIKCGTHSTLFLTLDGHVYSCGWNIHGQLGLGDKDIKSINIPTKIPDLPVIKQIEVGDNHCMCIDINNNLWVFGDNAGGYLGLSDKNNRYKPTFNKLINDVIGISHGGNHRLIKTSTNKIIGFGRNHKSQLAVSKSEFQLNPIQILKDNEDIWSTRIIISKNKKSARNTKD